MRKRSGLSAAGLLLSDRLSALPCGRQGSEVPAPSAILMDAATGDGPL